MSAFFVQKSFAQLFSNYSLASLFFGWKNIGAKAVCKMLMKLTIGISDGDLRGFSLTIPTPFFVVTNCCCIARTK